MTALPDQPTLLDVPPDEPAPEPKKPAPVRVKTKAELEREGVRRIYEQWSGGKPYIANAKDLPAWTRMREKVGVQGIEERWRIGLVASGWNHVDNLWQLETKWNEHTALIAKARPVTDETYVCEQCACVVDVATQGRLWLDKQWLCGRCWDAEFAARTAGAPRVRL